MDLSKEWYRSEFVKHESPIPHIAIENEFNEYTAIANGNLDYVRDHLNPDSFANPEGKGKLSENPLRNLKYHFVVATALITRYCAMSGMELEKAYTLSDFYILKMDTCATIEELVELHNTMCYDFCHKMHILNKSQVLSKPIVLCMDYIYQHLHSRITVQQLASHTGLSESYLSKLFHREIGMPISTYIIKQKLEKARNLLTYSNYSITDIANYLSFSSQSHFIQVFKKNVGMTPHKYRSQHFRNQWNEMTS